MPQPIAYDIVDKLYHAVMDHMPQVLQDRDIPCAFVLGFAGTYGVIWGLQWTSKHIVDKIFPDFDLVWLPRLEKACFAGMALAPVVYALGDIDTARQVMIQHPTYTSGMIGVYMGSLTAAARDLHNRRIQEARSRQEALEERLRLAEEELGVVGGG